MKIPEILAPAGDWASLNSAINAGANSVYLGVAEMNMRATAAKNFELKDLKEIVRVCKENNVKVFVTVNTLMYNGDLDVMKKIIDECKKTGVDAIIAADMATITYAREIGVSVQISTQISISNTESLKYYSQFADRVVLARELTLDQIKEIKEDIINQNIIGPKGELIELEVFAHGALCVAVSGRCYMSLYSSGTSANRGKCSQVCRRKFKVTDDTGKEMSVDNNYVMSAA
ncbi:MAG: U32 family peptidase, partial [Clostridiaceae bacterium]|nr:U32 family peptidase [Clostridiaceae bacterium]